MKDKYLIKMVGNPLETPPNVFTNEVTNTLLLPWSINLNDMVLSQQETLLYSPPPRIATQCVLSIVTQRGGLH